jgi:hypothetical protein
VAWIAVRAVDKKFKKYLKERRELPTGGVWLIGKLNGPIILKIKEM